MDAVQCTGIPPVFLEMVIHGTRRRFSDTSTVVIGALKTCTRGFTCSSSVTDLSTDVSRYSCCNAWLASSAHERGFQRPERESPALITWTPPRRVLALRLETPQRLARTLPTRGLPRVSWPPGTFRRTTRLPYALFHLCLQKDWLTLCPPSFFE